MNIIEKKEKLLNELSAIKGKDQRFEHIIALGKKTAAMADEIKDDKFLVKGCMSKAWLIPNMQDGRLHFNFDSDAIIVKGIMAVLMEVYNDNPPAENLSIDPAFLSEAGITDHLSMNRRNGLANLFKQIHLYSATFKALSNQLDKK